MKKTCGYRRNIFYIDNPKCLSIPVECPECGALIELERDGERQYLSPEHNVSADPIPNVKRWKRFGIGWDWRITETPEIEVHHTMNLVREDEKEEVEVKVVPVSKAYVPVKTPPVRIMHGSALDVLNSFSGETA